MYTRHSAYGARRRRALHAQLMACRHAAARWPTVSLLRGRFSIMRAILHMGTRTQLRAAHIHSQLRQRAVKE
jgi:hypothetical protein